MSRRDLNRTRLFSIDLEVVRRRLELGMDQQELAKLSGVPKMTLSDIESRKSLNPSIRTMYKLSRALNCPIEDLMEVT